jgi:hypothetical protein
MSEHQDWAGKKNKTKHNKSDTQFGLLLQWN